MVLQGGTCIFSGDEVQLLEQAAEIAEQNLKCTAVFGSVPLFKDGYSSARVSALDTNSTCAPNLDHLLTSWLSLETGSRHFCHGCWHLTAPMLSRAEDSLAYQQAMALPGACLRDAAESICMHPVGDASDLFRHMPVHSCKASLETTRKHGTNWQEQIIS